MGLGEPLSSWKSDYGLFHNPGRNGLCPGERGVVYRVDDERWRVVEPFFDGAPQAGWGASPNELFVVGYLGSIHHYDGSTWETIVEMDYGLETLYGVWGSGPDDVFMVGTGATVLHYDGKNIEGMNIPGSNGAGIWDVWGTGPDHVYAAASRNIFRYNGVAWNNAGAPDLQYRAIWGTSPTNIYAVSRSSFVHFDGVSWTETDLRSLGGGIDMYGVAEDEVFVMTGNGLLRFDGESLAAVDLGIDTEEGIQSMTYHPTLGYLMGVGSQVYLSTDLKTWSPLRDGTEMEIPIEFLWGFRDQVDYVSSIRELFRRSDSTWEDVIFGEQDRYFAIWGSGPDDLFIGGDHGHVSYEKSEGFVAHFDGTDWSFDGIEPGFGRVTPLVPRAFWGLAYNNIYAIGNYEHLVHYDGVEWSVLHTTYSRSHYSDLWASEGGEVFLVGTDGLIEIFADDTIVQEIKHPSKSHFIGVWGRARDDVYAAGRYGPVLQFDGREWNDLEFPGEYSITAIWGAGDNVLYVLQSSRHLYRYDGEGWTFLTSLPGRFETLWAPNENNLFVAGYGGFILQRCGVF